jgi:hypothetical protein
MKAHIPASRAKPAETASAWYGGRATGHAFPPTTKRNGGCAAGTRRAGSATSLRPTGRRMHNLPARSRNLVRLVTSFFKRYRQLSSSARAAAPPSVVRFCRYRRHQGKSVCVDLHSQLPAITTRSGGVRVVWSRHAGASADGRRQKSHIPTLVRPPGCVPTQLPRASFAVR